MNELVAGSYKSVALLPVVDPKTSTFPFCKVTALDPYQRLALPLFAVAEKVPEVTTTFMVRVA